MIQETRVRVLSDEPVRDGPGIRYVLYWMQQAQRVRFNHALEYAAEQANALGLPLLVGFGLMDDYPEANERHYAFMLEGLRDVSAELKARGGGFVLRHGSPPAVALDLARHAALVVCDRGYLRHQRRWREEVADRAGRRVVEVESDVVVPVEAASDKQESAARTLRPKIRKHLADYLAPLPATRLKHDASRLKVERSADKSQGDHNDFDPADAAGTLAKLKLDRSVPRSPHFEGGPAAAAKRLRAFLRDGLAGYAEGRREPAAAATSSLSGYLHFGQISSLQIALAVRDADAPQIDRDAYLEELIVRRELAANFVSFCPHYDAYEALPAWARKTLDERRRDERPHRYTADQLETARTHDEYWNAAQTEMVRSGFMQNSMRMYWGKKVLEWSQTPEEAFATVLYLNNKYFLCGRDMNGYANVAWVFGLHDRPWGPRRAVFGTVRYMNAAGLERKFDMDAYLRRVAAL